ncbi:MAG TPA: thiamine pyrophosphate-dependent enzyme [Bacteroidia bacterium]|nr:thiamine pyrophosphate-dependent enzyme [Bacteroidia bacterium]
MSQTAKSGKAPEGTLSYTEFKEIVLNDYRIANESRQVSLLGRKEVLTGKAKFGIFGDGKEIAQLAMAKVFRKGDFRSGYYRDQTFMMASGLLTIQEFFAQLYAHPDVNADPSSAGRLMNGHFSTRLLDEFGDWKDLTSSKNSSSDISPTAGQMPRLLGLALASKLYRQNKELQNDPFRRFSITGNEVAFGTIGDASTSEGLFFETINAAGVMQVPMAVSVWDDGYGISVPAKYQTTKQNISEVLKGFERTDDQDGFLIFTANGWDYPGLVEMYEKGIEACRSRHIPVLFHIKELTQPQGHSTSGSHERYKSKERLRWEEEYDCIKKMREWMMLTAVATSEELDAIEKEARKAASEGKNKAWQAFRNDVSEEVKAALSVLQNCAAVSANRVFIEPVINRLAEMADAERQHIATAVKETLRYTRGESNAAKTALLNWFTAWDNVNVERFDSNLYSESAWSAIKVKEVPAEFGTDAAHVDGREVLLANFDYLMRKYPQLVAFGEDVGQIGGVNQTWAGLQEKYGLNRIFDTGIREATIIGQGIGMALRGLRPIAEIQYLDYLVYAMTVITDDLACLQYRTKGGQKAPLIISTRGHRLEGVWHSGSPISMILGALRGVYVLVPRNMTQAAGFYNTMLASDEPALIIEPLNGYRIKEKMPSNIGEFNIPVGVPEIIREGDDITIVTYGSMCRVVMDAVEELTRFDISCEVIDVRSLLPFDIKGMIGTSLKKTNKILFVDEDVPGGGTAYMMQQVIEKQEVFDWLEIPPATLAAKDHRPAYGSDGDYYSKPNSGDVFDAVYGMISNCNPGLYPPLYS